MNSKRLKTLFLALLAICAASVMLIWLNAEKTYSQVQIVNAAQAKEKLINQLYQGKLGERALFLNPVVKKSGAAIASWRVPEAVRVEKSSWFFFIDEQPGANWEHEAKYVLVDAASGALRSIPSRTPPREIMEMRAESPQAMTQMEMLKKNLQLWKRMEIKKRIIFPLKQRRYAVLVSGGWDATYNYPRYWNDLAFIYKALKEKYKFTDDEIIVLYADGSHSPNEDLDGDGVNDVDYAASKSNLTTVMDTVASNLPADGKFFFYSTNHGGLESGSDVYLYLWGEWILDDEFANLTKKIKCGEAIYVMEQCHSGGMMDDLLKAQTYPCTNPQVCIMTAANASESSWSCDSEGNYDEYVYYWTSAVYGKTPTGTSVNADMNGDGKVSMHEAHEYAKSNDSRSEHPQSGSCVTGACDATLFAKWLIMR